MKFDAEDYVTANLSRAKPVQSGSGHEMTAVCPACDRYGGFYVNTETGAVCYSLFIEVKETMPKGSPGKRKSDDHRAKIRAYWTPERREAQRKKLLGRKHSEATKKKIGDAQRGIPSGIATSGFSGRRHTEEARRKISQSLIGNQHTNGHRLSIEHKRKVRESWTPEMRAEAARRGAERVSSQDSSGTAPERAVEAKLISLGVPFRAQAMIDGDPHHVYDFVIDSKRTVIEVDGCFYHGCDACGVQPLDPSIQRKDKIKSKTARRLGWRVIRVRECRA